MSYPTLWDYKFGRCMSRFGALRYYTHLKFSTGIHCDIVEIPIQQFHASGIKTNCQPCTFLHLHNLESALEP